MRAVVEAQRAANGGYYVMIVAPAALRARLKLMITDQDTKRWHLPRVDAAETSLSEPPTSTT